MFNKDFYPTPENVIDIMVSGLSLESKTVLEPSAGKGNIVDYLLDQDAKVLTCENNLDLSTIVSTKSDFLKPDFFNVTKEEVSHIDYIIMNPPFSKDVDHVLHAYEVAPDGCLIIALVNTESIENTFSRKRKILKSVISENGDVSNLGDCFLDAERKTGVNVSLVTIQKPTSINEDWSGYFEMEDSDQTQGEGMMSYNSIRAIVNSYVGALKLYQEAIGVGVKMNKLIGHLHGNLCFTCTEDGKEKTYESFKKALQKESWEDVFRKMKMDKYLTKNLKADINKFVEKQHTIPFTMKNIYEVLEIVVGTHGSRMDKGLVEVFDTLTKHYKENRYSVEGWKTNSHYMINKKFILGFITEVRYSGGLGLRYNSNADKIDDLQKALCYLMGKNYDNYSSLWQFVSNRYMSQEEIRADETIMQNYEKQYDRLAREHGENKISKVNWINSQVKRGTKKHRKFLSFGKWYDWGFFEVKGFKKGTMHFKFKDQKVWEMFNRRVAEIKGFDLPESI